MHALFSFVLIAAAFLGWILVYYYRGLWAVEKAKLDDANFQLDYLQSKLQKDLFELENELELKTERILELLFDPSEKEKEKPLRKKRLANRKK